MRGKARPKLGWMQHVQSVIMLLLLTNFFVLAAVWLLPWAAGGEANGSDNTSPYDTAIPVQQDTSLLFGNLQLQTEDGLCLEKALLICNERVVGNFGQGQLTIRVYDGDQLIIDGSAYKRELHFIIKAVSSNIDHSVLPDSITTNGHSVALAAIQFK